MIDSLESPITLSLSLSLFKPNFKTRVFLFVKQSENIPPYGKFRHVHPNLVRRLNVRFPSLSFNRRCAFNETCGFGRPISER